MRVFMNCICWILCLRCALGFDVDEKRCSYIKMRCEEVGLQDPQLVDDFCSLTKSGADMGEVELKYEELHNLIESHPKYHFLQRPIYDVFWTRKTRARLGHEVVDFYFSKIPDSIKDRGSIVLAGNDISYFLLPSHLDRSIVISQNFLFDEFYREYIDYLYEGRISLPSNDDLTRAIKSLVHDYSVPGKKVTVKEVEALDKVNQELVLNLIKSNEGKKVFVDEKYRIKDLHSYARPRGFFLEICPAEYPINEEVIEEDRNFWGECEKHISKNFSTNQLARWIFSENRCMSAGVYASQKLYAEAEVAFLQAIRIAPDHWKPRIRICHEVFIPCGKYEDALSIVDDYLSLVGAEATDRAKELKKHVQKLKEEKVEGFKVQDKSTGKRG